MKSERWRGPCSVLVHPYVKVRWLVFRSVLPFLEIGHSVFLEHLATYLFFVVLCSDFNRSGGVALGPPLFS